MVEWYRCLCESKFFAFSPFTTRYLHRVEWTVHVYVAYLPNILNALFPPFFPFSLFPFFFLFRRKKTTRGRISRRLKKISLLKQSRKLETLLGILKRALEKYTSRFKKANNFTYAKECLTN